MSDSKLNRPKTFSEAQGFEPLPSPLALNVVSERARNDLWNWLWAWFQETGTRDGGLLNGGPEMAVRAAYVDILHAPLDLFPRDMGMLALSVKPWFMTGPFNTLFDIVQHMLRTHAQSQFEPVRQIFRDNLLAYDILDIPPLGPTIVPNVSPEEGEAVQRAFQELAANPFAGARQHLHQAAEFINAGNAPKAVAEAIHAVESVVRIVAPDNSFSKALKAIGSKSELHPAFAGALAKLYGYTSDEKGIRHPLLDSDTSNVGMPEAVFMFGACASFITYVITRAREAGLINQ